MTNMMELTREALLDHLADRILATERPHPLRVAIDGPSASGKTSLGDELAETIRARGRSAHRASLDDFKRPWSERHLYDRESGEGYYRNAYDYDRIRDELLAPLGPAGNRRYRFAYIDPGTQRPREDAVAVAEPDAVLLADGVFMFRPQIDGYWDFRIFLELDFDLVLQRGTERDQGWAGGPEAAAALFRTRYIPSEEIYFAEVDPRSRADVIVEQRDFQRPRLLRP